MSNVTETAVKETVQPAENVQEKTQTESNVNSFENKKESSIPPAANLIPAPIPTSSPWKSVNKDIPVTSISVEDFESLKKKSPTPSIKSNTSTKWVPIKASITVSNNSSKNGSKNKNHRHTHNGKRNSNNSKNKQNHSKKNKKNSNQNKQQEKTENGEASQPTVSSDEDTSVSTTTTIATETTTASTVNEKQTSTEINDSNAPVKTSEEQPQEPQQQHSHNNNSRQKRFNNKHHSHHFNTNNNRKFQNKQQQGQGQAQNGFTSKQNNNNTNFRHNNNNQKHHSFRPQQMAQLYSMLYPFHYSMMAVNSVARQIEYYLSDENLVTDDYLKQQLSKDGYVPLSLLSKFYRLLNMSFGGDLNIIMAALREIVFNENATVEVAQGEQIIDPVEESTQEEEEKEQVQEKEQEQEGQENEKKSVTEPSPLTKYFIRSKNWEKWLPEKPAFEVEIHKTLSGNDLDEFMLKMVTVPHHHNYRNHNHHSHRNNRNHQQQKGEEKDGENSTAESNESTNQGTVADESAEGLVEQDDTSTSTTDVEKSIPVEDTSKEGSVPVEVNQSS
ncbi:hypothetical protein RI543_003525 [Arxiozyma heterogenica]|uniref:HTH La-type RNA-binding domain-containing protein n=1 Tax=Arxiozyma heterogenica TaxID=278026 RepID=A0AAN7WGN3_9SACH|nr:hypothetical protein RI543_003525 [Kazachstania heterogenica]